MKNLMKTILHCLFFLNIFSMESALRRILVDFQSAEGLIAF